MAPSILLVAFLGGVLPAFVWLFFWLLEDRCEPEPKRFVFFVFLTGMVAVLVAFPAERFVAGYLSGGGAIFFCWATIEEFLNFGAAYVAVLRFRFFDEPLDAIIYM